VTLHLEHSPSGRVSVLRLEGEHDITTAHEIRRALVEVPDREDLLVVVDLAPCTFLDSTVIGILVAAGKRFASRGARLLVLNAAGIPAKALRVTGADKVLQSEARPDLLALAGIGAPISFTRRDPG
jgi:anti-anti-sigma factor